MKFHIPFIFFDELHIFFIARLILLITWPKFKMLKMQKFYSKMFTPANDSKKGNFLEQTKAAREERAYEKKRDNAAEKIQSFLKGCVTRSKFRKEVM